jgi:hypothetical protein
MVENVILSLLPTPRVRCEKIINELVHKQKIIAISNLQKLKEERSCKGSKVYKKFQEELFLSFNPFIYTKHFIFKM